MMKLDRATKLNAFKILSFFFLIFVVTVFINVMFNDDIEVSVLLKKIKKQKEEKKFDFCKTEKEKLFDLNSFTTCGKEPSKLTYFFYLTDNRYLYYSFALMLGGVLNSKNIIKIGIF